MGAALPRAEVQCGFSREADVGVALRGLARDAESGPRRLHIRDCRHSFTSQSMMNGVGLANAGKLLGHSRRGITA